MKLTSFTDYTLRVLMYLALHQERLATIQGIAQAYAISENHLMKVVHHLAKTGVIESVRGKGGGIRLAFPPEQIRLGAVVRAAEGDSPIAECFGESNACCITASCQLIPILAQAFDALYAVLDQHTLADLVHTPIPMARLLKIEFVR
ncbi:RrF2 family transcriptional regulator [Uliginosibacterium gangwonense]|uniref:RrF2 family transcriptional regulator n=1 Tax=Uliginosibacterium gangwonense TaxID=392736 RepID=UPI0003717DCD|nr:Rrf2 family transcriptional regulator [Uliginosibacterium gangwonense]